MNWRPVFGTSGRATLGPEALRYVDRFAVMFHQTAVGVSDYSKKADLIDTLMIGIDDVDIDDLPRGVIIGTVELYDCDGGDWYVRSPERAKRLRKPRNHPQPVWFNPF